MAYIVPFFWSPLMAIMGRINICWEYSPLLGKYRVPTFVEHNPFGRIKCIDQDNPRLF